MSTFTFAIPKRKKRVFCKKEAPFPVPIATVSGRPASPHNWEHYTGHLVDGHVIITDKTDAKALYTMGFFGKGTLSRSQPEHGQIRPALKRRHKPTESKTTERMLQLVSRRKYLCHVNWSHQRAGQRGDSPPDHSVESDDIGISDDQVASAPQQHPTPSKPDTVGRTFLPCRQQNPWEEGSVGNTLGLGERPGSREDEGGREDRDKWAGGDREKGPWAGGDREKDPWAGGDREKGPWAGGDREKDPWAGGDREKGPWAGGEREKDPWAGGDREKDPWAGRDREKDPWAGRDREKDPWAGGEREKDPWAGRDREKDPWAGGEREKDPWAGGDTAESLQFWDMGETVKVDTYRDNTDMSPVVTDGTDKSAQRDNVMLRTTQSDGVTSRTTQSDVVTLKTTQSDDVTTQSDDVTLRTTQNDDVTLKTTQSDDVTLRTTQSGDVNAPTRQTNAEYINQNCPHLTESTTATSVSVPATVSSDDTTEGQRSVSREVDPRSVSAQEDGDWFVVPDSWDSDQEIDQATTQLPWQPEVKRDPFKLHECLQLSLVEAFFLSYGLGCLTVVDNEKGALSVTEMWIAFCKCQKNFLRDYVAYHNFRSKGWVPKTGLKYGAEFILYKDGPPFYHASYSVMVRLVTHDLQDDPENRHLTWTSLAGLNRMTEQVGKEVMLCYVIKPKDVSATDIQSPACLSRFTVQEVILRRWVSAQEREHTECGDML